MRTVSKLVTGWTFHTSFSPALIAKATPGEAVRLPHNAVDLDMTYFDECSFQKEFAYQYTLAWTPDMTGREVALRFDGAMANSVVWVNGQQVAAHKDGYTPFTARLTGLLKEGDNLITVKVDGSENPEIPPFGGQIDYLTYAGIYRDVWIVSAPEIHFAQWGTACRVESLTDRRALLAVDYALERHVPATDRLEVAVTLRDADGVEVAAARGVARSMVCVPIL